MALSVLLVAGLAAAAPPVAAEPPLPGDATAECPPELRHAGAQPATAEEGEALRLAAACDVRVEVTSARGIQRRTWAQPSGSLRTELYAVPRWTRDGSGEWVDVDTSLVRAADGSVRSVATVSAVRLSGGGKGPFVTLTDPDGGTLSLTWPGELPAPSLAGDTATYAGVLPGVDLLVTAGVDGFAYRLVVHDARAAASPELARLEVGIAGDGLTVSQTRSGVVRAVDAAGKLVFQSGAAMMWDSSGPAADPAAGPAAEPADAPPGRVTTLPVALAGDTLVVVPDAAMLADPDTVFPVAIDPPFTGSRLAWANVHRERASSGWTSDSAWPRSGGMRVGLCTWTTPVHCSDGWGLWRSVVRFNTEPLGGKHILSAAVKMTQTHTGGCGTYPLRLYQVSAFSSGVSWNGVNWLNLLQTRNVASSNDGCGSGNQPVTFNSSTVRSKVQNHADQGYDSISFGVRSGDEGSRNQWRRISRDSLKLEVEHATYPKTPTNLSTHGKGCATTSGSAPWLTTGQPKLSGQPRNGDGKGRYYLQVRTTTSSTNVYTYRSGVITVNTTVSKTIPSSAKLADGFYRWLMRSESWDSSVPASAYSAWCYFRVDTTPPPEPSATQLTADPNLGDSVQFRLTGSSDTNRFRYSVTGGSSTTVSGPGGSAVITVDPPDTSIDHQLQVWALDAAGNESVRHDLWFTTGKDLSKLPVAGAWRFGGDWRDDSGNGHDLAAGPGVSAATDRAGRSAAAAGFTAAPGGCLSSDGPVLDTSGSFTVAAWVKMTDGGAAGTNPTVISQAGDYRSAFYIAWYRNTGQWQFTMPSADAASVTWQSIYSTAPADLGAWTHVAGVHDAAAGQIRLYVGGELQETNDAHASMWNAGGPLRIGCATRQEGQISNEVRGDIDDVVAYQGVLTGDRIGKLMAAGPPAGQVSWWPLRANGTDAGPGGNDLTLPAAVSWVPDSFGRAGSAMRLDGTGCAATGAPVVRTDDSFTVAAWVRPTGTAGGTVVSQAGENTFSFQLRRHSGGQWGIVLAGSDTATPERYVVYAPPEATTGGWQHLTAVYDASLDQIRLYVDGVERATGSLPVDPWRGTGGLHVGCSADASGTISDAFAGSIHDVRAWRGAASPDQVRAVAVQQLSFWGLDESGTDAWGDNQLDLVGEYDWVTDRFGWPGSAFGLSLDGTGWAETAGPVIATDESFTVSAWTKLDDKGGYRTVVAQAGGEVAGFNLNYHAGSDRWQLSVASEDSTESVQWHQARSLQAPVIGQWYHLAGVYDLGANRLSLFVNGTRQESVPGPAQPWRAGGEFLVGSAGNAAGGRWNPMVGAVDMVRVYSGALDAARLADQGVAPTFGTLRAGFTAVEQDGFDTTVAEVPVSLAEPVDNPVTVEYQTVTPVGDGYAASPEDFEAVAGTVTFQPGEMTKTVPVTVNGDSQQPEDLLAVVEFQDPTNAAVEGDGRGGVWIVANPGSGVTATIDTPTGTGQWRAGEQITFAGHASDAGGQLPGSALSWQLRQVDCGTGTCETEVLDAWSGVATGSFTTPAAPEPVLLELVLTAAGATGTAEDVLALDPATVELTVDSEPAGAEVTIGAMTGEAPLTSTVVQGAAVDLAAPSPQDLGGAAYTFDSWSDGGAAAHTITAPASATTYTGTYTGGIPSGYTMSSGARAFVPVTESVAVTGDDEFTAVTLPFPVSLYGRSYTTAWVDTNGVVSFMEPDGSSWEAAAIPSAAVPNQPNAAVYPFWEDLNVDAGATVLAEVVGSAPDRQFVIEWRNVTFWEDGSLRVSFQVVLGENGDIAIAWDGIDAAALEQGAGAVVGIENAEGTEAMVFSQFEPVLASGQGVLFQAGAPPASSGDLTGTVTCGGVPANDVHIGVSDASTETGVDGSWELAGLPTGSDTVVATAAAGPCAGSTLQGVTVVGGGTTNVGIALTVAGFGYTAVGGSRPYLPVSSELALTGDESYLQLDLPFPVSLYGQSYTTAWVDTNGVVSFMEPDGSSWDTAAIPSAAVPNQPNAAVYPFWEDLNVDAEATVLAEVVGSAPDRQFVIEWRNVTFWGDDSLRVSFQVVLGENGDIAIAWDGIDVSALEQGIGAVVGIENADGTEAMAYSQFAPVLASGQGVLFQPPAAAPGENLALGAPVEADVSSCAGAEGPAAAVNGSQLDKWCSAGDPAWLRVDLGAVTAIGNITLRHAGAGGEEPEKNTSEYVLKVSQDGVNWTTVAHVTGNTHDLTSHDVTASGRYVQLEVLVPNSYGNPYARIYQLEVYG